MQHLLSKEKFIELKDAFIKFNSLNASEQQVIQEHTISVWDKLCHDYFAACQQDPQWVKLHHLINSHTIDSSDSKQKLTRINDTDFAFQNGFKMAKANDNRNQTEPKQKPVATAKTKPYQAVKVEFDKLNRLHADQIIAQALNQNIGIICFEHNSDYQTKQGLYPNSSYLNDACNDIRDIIMEMIVLNNEAQSETSRN